MEPISPKHITVTDPFWAPRIRTVADIVLPYQWQVLHDQVPGAPKSSCIANFQKAAHAIAAAKAGGPRPTYPTDKWYYDDKNSQENAFMGWVFQDSDLYKWLEAAAYAIPYGNRAYLTEKSREAVEIIAAAQETDGYLDTLYSINGLQNRFTNLKDYHELYCFGHLAQAACARWTMQGERDLLDIACRAADCICRTFGSGKRPGYPGHPLAELALVQLYEVTGKADYLQTADFFIRTRGTRPLFFDRERGVDTDGSDYVYNQTHCPLTAQTTAVGHAVRGVYLYTGAAAVAEHTGNRALQATCETLWQDLCRTKLYVTGALGQTAVGRGFWPGLLSAERPGVRGKLRLCRAGILCAAAVPLPPARCVRRRSGACPVEHNCRSHERRRLPLLLRQSTGGGAYTERYRTGAQTPGVAPPKLV